MAYTSPDAVKESTNYLCKAWVHKDDICMRFKVNFIHYLIVKRDRDNLQTKDKRPVPKVSFVRRFDCIASKSGSEFAEC